MQRRQWLMGMLAHAALTPVYANAADDRLLQVEDLALSGSSKFSRSKFSRSARLLVDPHAAPQRLLILLHGRGEADSTALALKAWSHLYGALEAYTRLQHPPLHATLKEPRWEADRAERMNTALASDPFRGFAILCPVTPNPAAFGNRAALYRDYTSWLVGELVPAVRERLPSIGERIGLDGCSMGGALAFEIFLERPEVFKSFGTVQAAIGNARADSIAARFAHLAATQAPPRVHVLTSSGDPYLQANERLSQRLNAAQIDNTLNVIHGPHNQPWLRQMGTVAMLYWHDRAL